MSILALTSHLPWPLDRGGHIRSFYLLRELARRMPLRLVAGAFGSSGADALASAGIDVRPVPLRRVSATRDLPKVTRAFVQRRPYVCYARHDHAAVRAALVEEFHAIRPDILYLDHLDSFQLFDALPRIPTVVDMHNVYSSLVRRTGEERQGVVRMYLRREARLLARVESRAVKEADAMFAVSPTDQEHFLSLGGQHIHVIPNGVDCERYVQLPVGRAADRPLVLYVGSLSWQPNADAVKFLLRHVLPELRSKTPGARIRVVGRGADDELVRLGDRPGVEILTNEDDVRPHLAEAHVLAVPLEAGGGSRLKILEAFAAGLPVVSTAVGAEGIDAEDGTHLLLAERAEFATAIARLVRHEDLGRRLAHNARALAQERYDWVRIGAQAASVVESLLRQNRDAARQPLVAAG